MFLPFVIRVKPRAIDLWLAGQPTGGQVQLPLKESYEEDSLYYTLYSQKPLIGLIRTFPSNRYFELEPQVKNFPDQASQDDCANSTLLTWYWTRNFIQFNDGFIERCEDLGMRFGASLDGQAVSFCRR